MNRHLRIRAALSAAGAVFLAFSSTALAQQDPVARGDYLVNGILNCGNCHTPRDATGNFVPGMDLAGGFRIDELPAFDAYAKNITPDVDTGIGSWSVEEIITSIREGHTPEGEKIGPPMPIFFYTNMSDEDASAVAAYLKSIPAVRNEVPESTYNIPIPDYPPATHALAPSPSDQVAYGGYLAMLGHCFECHTPRNPDGSPDMTRMGSGGFGFAGAPSGATIYSANITPDPATGVGNWTDDELRRAITEGIGHDGQPLFPLMPAGFFKNVTEDDISAVIAYLRTLPAVVNEVERNDWRPGT
ncbi:MAG: c-type cytochrome [Bauldia sp.]|nr:c-type cytochrome [Bauldia sp.]